MSKLSQKVAEVVGRVKSIVGIVAVWDDVKEKVKETSPELYGFFDALARDDRHAAARELLNWESVVDVVAALLERVDDIFPEEKVIALMELARLPRE